MALEGSAGADDVRRGLEFKRSTVWFWGVHVYAAAGIAWWGWSWSGFGLALALYWGRMFFVTAGYHRYFSHRTYKTSRPMQLLLALGAVTTVQKGVFWWSSHHRRHHKYSDEPEDLHSVKQRGLWWAHVGWILAEDHDRADMSWIPDLTRYPELRWLERNWLFAPVLLAAFLWIGGGAEALLWGFFVSTVLLWHGTFTINSLAHVIGRRRYATTDDSKNHWLLALITMGEGWHNNHHHYQSSANQGFRWYEVDVTYYLLKLLEKVGLVWAVRRAPDHVVAGTPAPAEAPVELPRAA